MRWLVFLCLGVSFSAQAQSLKAGLWKAHSEIQLAGIPLPTSDDEQCVSQEQARDVKKTLTSVLAKKGCTINHWKLQAKKLLASLECKNKDFTAKGDMQGTVTNKNYELAGHANGSFKGIPTSAKIRLTGKWSATCSP